MIDADKTWRLIKLNFGKTPAHFGALGIGMEETSERVRSDTLFSAWISAYARLFGDRVEDLLERFPRCFSDPEQNNPSTVAPPFSLSSTFIYREFKDSKDQPPTVYYLPRPLQFPPNYPAGKDDLEFTKTYKGLKFLPLDVWHRWYQGEGFTEADREELIAETQKTYSRFTQLKDAGTFAYKEAFKSHKVPKVAIDRSTRATNLYYTGFVQFQWETNPSGLYFLLHFPEPDAKLEEDLKAALDFLGEEGIGGERSSGAGRFTKTWHELPSEWTSIVNPPEITQSRSLLSLFWNNTVNADFLGKSSYELLQRSGWIASPSGQQRRRQVVSMFAEGSVFLTQPVHLQGKLVEVTPPSFTGGHKIYRSGIGLSLPIKVLEGT